MGHAPRPESDLVEQLRLVRLRIGWRRFVDATRRLCADRSDDGPPVEADEPSLRVLP